MVYILNAYNPPNGAWNEYTQAMGKIKDWLRFFKGVPCGPPAEEQSKPDLHRLSHCNTVSVLGCTNLCSKSTQYLAGKYVFQADRIAWDSYVEIRLGPLPRAD